MQAPRSGRRSAKLAEADIFLNDDGSFGRVEYLTVDGRKISRGDQYETHGSYEQGTGYKWTASCAEMPPSQSRPNSLAALAACFILSY